MSFKVMMHEVYLFAMPCPITRRYKMVLCRMGRAFRSVDNDRWRVHAYDIILGVGLVVRRNEHDSATFAMALERVMCFDMILIFRVVCHSGVWT